MDHTRSKAPIYFFIAVLVVSLIALFLLVDRCSSDKADATGGNTDSSGQADGDGGDSISLNVDGEHVDDVSTGHAGTPEELVGKISDVMLEANDTGDIRPLITMLGQSNLTPAQQEHLRKLAQASRLKLQESRPFSAMANNPSQWALNLADRNKILLDLKQNPDGKWRVGGVTLPGEKPGTMAGQDGNANDATPEAELAASKSVRGFMDAIMKLDPATARQYIDTSKVSYARLAGLCIIFEEGKYKLIEDRPIRKMFLNDTAAGWLTRVDSADTGEAAMFAINTKRKDVNSPWKITEINLDKLLANYAKNFSGGDIHYTPLIKNPKGGDSLVIYFDLDSGELTARTQRQLTIIANLLKADISKKLTISGHTDALGSDDYNLKLSKQRAETVVSFLREKKVAAKQMEIVGFGKSKPRVPNTTEDGEDDPDGRRANRRAEILLDF